MLGFIIIAIAIILLFSAVLILKNMQITQAKNILERFKGNKVLRFASNANFFGQESQGLAQIRGNGVLLLTEEELYFEMRFPKKEFHIPIFRILRVETPKSHLKKSKFFPLLKVIFKNNHDATDSVAWLVENLTNWKENIESLAQIKNEK